MRFRPTSKNSTSNNVLFLFFSFFGFGVLFLFGFILALSFSGTDAKAEELTFDSNNRAALAVYQDGSFQIVSEFAATESRNCGAAEDIPVPGNYFASAPGKTAVWNPSFGVWKVCGTSAALNRPWGVQGDIPAPGDYDGNGFTDYTVFRPSTGQWFVLSNTGGIEGGNVSVVDFGQLGDVPAPADYDGDGKTDFAVVRQDKVTSAMTWFIKTATGAESSIAFGLLGDVPVAADYDGDGSADVAVYRANEGAWYIQDSNGATERRAFGLPADIPSPADIDNDGSADLVVYRPSAARFFLSLSSNPNAVTESVVGAVGARVANDSRVATTDRVAPADMNGDRSSDLLLVRTGASSRLQFFTASVNGTPQTNSFIEFGEEGNAVVFGDYDGDGKTDPSVASIAGDFLVWKLLLSGSQAEGRQELAVTYGLQNDSPVPADYDGDGKTDLAVVRVLADNSKLWLPNSSGSQPLAAVSWGFGTDRHRSADVDGDGRSDYIVLREQGNQLLWLTRTANGEALPPRLYGFTTDEPVVGDFDGDGRAEIGVVRETNGFKLVLIDGFEPFIWGVAGDVSLFANYSGRAVLDAAVWRVINGQGFFFVRGLGAVTLPFGVSGDIPFDTRVARVASSDNGTTTNSPTTDTPNTTDTPTTTGGGQRLSCNAGESNVANQGGNFVWKPTSEGDGNLVVLFESSRSGQVKRAALVDRQSGGDVVLETMRFVGNTNGGRPTFRASRRGSSYPSNLILVRQGQDDSVHCITVPSPGSRYD